MLLRKLPQHQKDCNFQYQLMQTTQFFSGSGGEPDSKNQLQTCTRDKSAADLSTCSQIRLGICNFRLRQALIGASAD